MSSREPANPIASGRTADVHPWGEGRVLKLYRPGTSPRTVESEQRKTSAAHAIGLPVPAVGSRIELDGRLGLVLERVDGLSMMETVLRDPDTIEPMALRLAEVHLDLHAHEGSPGLHDQRTLLREKIARCAPLSQAEREAVLGAMARLPGGDRLCHGDFHPANVILTDRDPVIIDWIDASRGNPLADVARTALILLSPGWRFRSLMLANSHGIAFARVLLDRWIVPANTAVSGDPRPSQPSATLSCLAGSWPHSPSFCLKRAGGACSTRLRARGPNGGVLLPPPRRQRFTQRVAAPSARHPAPWPGRSTPCASPGRT
ncbi:phosphotransferase family protein [Limnochorda pilosa]|uniref:phosphotransferase family protein n=1 Tax=Limnochorda pilosa TaxID=1555112 RepID=UPI0009E7EED7